MNFDCLETDSKIRQTRTRILGLYSGKLSCINNLKIEDKNGYNLVKPFEGCFIPATDSGNVHKDGVNV